ncbi:hypothetical protein AKG34_20260 [Peribacillus butanolivorans]|nr:hypothetical protein AKG34_20260 [Peribacillus butanolivorans]
MLVKDIIKKNCKQKMTIKEIAIHHHVSDRTIHNKIKKLSYEWGSRNTNSVGLFIFKKIKYEITSKY